MDALLKENAQPIADALVKEIAKPAKDAMTEVVRSGDLIAYTAEEAVRYYGEGQFLMSDSFPGQERSKLCLSSKVSSPACAARLGELSSRGDLSGRGSPCPPLGS